MPKIVRIYSENATFQLIEALRRNREKRQKQHEFLVEGVRPINLALQQGWTIKAWLYSPERKLSDWASNLLDHSSAQHSLRISGALVSEIEWQGRDIRVAGAGGDAGGQARTDSDQAQRC